MPEPETRPLLILDLDETLIHSTTRRLDRDPDFRAGHYPANQFTVLYQPDQDVAVILENAEKNIHSQRICHIY